jgi:two-component system, NarL family, nitrate/nitrite response regulator NarL
MQGKWVMQEGEFVSSRTSAAAVATPAAVVAAVVSSDRLLGDGIKAILEGRGFSVGLGVSHIKDVMHNLRSGAGPPDVLILVGALTLDGDEISALDWVREAAPDLRIIVFAEEGAEPRFLRRLISIGVDALLPTNLSAEILVQSIRLVLLGEGFMFREYVQRVVEREPHVEISMPDLTPRELQIIRFMALGQSNRTIAGRLDLTEASVKVHIRRLLRKLGASNRTQAAIWAVERGLVRAEQLGDTSELPGVRM